MFDPEKYKDKAVRFKPSQARGKERVRIILAAALGTFRDRGLDQATTNDIAERAGVPIGSIYRYYPNRDSIVSALVDLYTSDISKIFNEVGKHPMLKYLSWEEVLLLMVDGWVQYARLNGFALLYAVRANPRLYAQNQKAWQQLYRSFAKVIKKRCPTATEKDIMLCFQFCLTASEMGINSDNYEAIGSNPQYDAVNIIASYMLRVCGSASSDDDEILA